MGYYFWYRAPLITMWAALFAVIAYNIISSGKPTISKDRVCFITGTGRDDMGTIPTAEAVNFVRTYFSFAQVYQFHYVAHERMMEVLGSNIEFYDECAQGLDASQIGNSSFGLSLKIGDVLFVEGVGKYFIHKNVVKCSLASKDSVVYCKLDCNDASEPSCLKLEDNDFARIMNFPPNIDQPINIIIVRPPPHTLDGGENNNNSPTPSVVNIVNETIEIELQYDAFTSE